MSDGSGVAAASRVLQSLCCSLPLSHVHIDATNLERHKNLRRIQFLLAVVALTGLVHALINARFSFNDFFKGGNDLFSALLGFLALRDVCSVNASWFLSLLVWATVSSILFDLLLSLLPNLFYWNSYASQGRAAFAVDNLLMTVVALTQLYLAFLVKQTLDDMLPGWANIASGSGSADFEEPFINPSRHQQSRSQGPSTSRSNTAFVPFGGSGQRLG